jgi:PAS domain S-box-containing protein
MSAGGDRRGALAGAGSGPVGTLDAPADTAAPEVVGLCDRSGRLLHASPPPGAEAQAGAGCEAGAGRSWHALGVPAEVVGAIERRCPEVADSGRPAVEEVRVPNPAAECPDRVVECLLTPIPLEAAAVAAAGGAVAVVVRDVTEARRAEGALRESERQYRLLAENSTDMITRHDPAGRYLYISPAGRAVSGYEPRELIGRSPYDFIHPDDLAEVHRVHSLMLASTEPFSAAFRARRRGGAYVWLETTARAVREPETGRVVEIQCSTRDITPRKQAEQELRESRELLQAVLDNCPSASYIKDIQGRYILVNRRFEALYGVSRRQVIGRTDPQVFPAPRAEAILAADRAVLVSGRAVEAEEVVAPDEGAGDGPHALLTVRFPLADRDGIPYAVCAVSTDITARRQVEEALQAKSAVLRSVLDNMADAVIMADEAERFLEFNPAAQRMFGTGPTETRSPEWSERYGLYLPDAVTAFPAEDLPLARAVRGEATNDVEMFVRHGGEPEGLWVLINGRPLTGDDGRPRGGVIVCREITERKTAEERLRLQNVRLQEAAELERLAHEALKQAEAQLIQAEKLTALGQMVAGVAHEVNNPLSFVSNNLAVLQRDVASLGQLVRIYQEADPVLEAHAPDTLGRARELGDQVDLGYTLENLDRLVDRSREGLRRIQQIVKDLRDFARPDGGLFESVDLNAGVASTVNIILGRAKAQGVELLAELNPLPPVTCQPGKINQVVMNLLANAIDACPAGRKVSVRTEAAPGADGVVLTVADTGTGIDPAVRDRIFDPFFTTKPVGRGTGLGLSISYGIVQAHGGTIAVESEPGAGSTFTVRLPLTPPVAALPKP